MGARVQPDGGVEDRVRFKLCRAVKQAGGGRVEQEVPVEFQQIGDVGQLASPRRLHPGHQQAVVDARLERVLEFVLAPGRRLHVRQTVEQRRAEDVERQA